MTQYRGGSDQFAAIGDEHGLLLVMKRGRVIDFTSEPHNAVRVYPTAVTVRGDKAATHPIAGYPYRLEIEARCACG